MHNACTKQPARSTRCSTSPRRAPRDPARQVGTRPYSGGVPTVEMVFVISSVLQAVGFDAERGALHVRFRNGSTYVYSGVPERVYRELLQPGSKGGFSTNVVKPSDPGRELVSAAPEARAQGEQGVELAHAEDAAGADVDGPRHGQPHAD